MAIEFGQIAAAKKEAAARANRDGCKWEVWTNNISTNYPFRIVHEYDTKWNPKIFGDRRIAVYGPDNIPITLTREEAELVEYILREDSLGADRGHDAETRQSTWEKIKKYLASL